VYFVAFDEEEELDEDEEEELDGDEEEELDGDDMVVYTRRK
jgi:hypothetical protein